MKYTTVYDFIKEQVIHTLETRNDIRQVDEDDEETMEEIIGHVFYKDEECWLDEMQNAIIRFLKLDESKRVTKEGL